jgi:hypothetical protein
MTGEALCQYTMPMPPHGMGLEFHRIFQPCPVAGQGLAPFSRAQKSAI